MKLDYNDVSRKQLINIYHPDGIPQLILIDNDGNVLVNNAVKEIQKSDKVNYS